MTPSGAAGPAAAGEEGMVESAGHFRLYMGAAPGVGKTFAMLAEGHRRAERGTDVVVGFVECHGRPHTAEQLAGLEVVPRQRCPYRGSWFEEMDVDAVVARNPRVALIDELAHTNVPGSGRHLKRWQDVLEVLDAGIDVISTVNIQHLESVADAVESMTGARVQERVPDWVVRKANQIELVDSSPEALRRRMLHGNIYPRDRVPKALANFFRTDHLIALRELALRFVADETEEDLLEHLRRHSPPGVWETTERILVAVTAAPGTDALMRRAARMAARAKAHLDVLHVGTGDVARPGDDGKLMALRDLATALGADWHEVHGSDAARAITRFAADHQTTQIVIGASRRNGLDRLTKGRSIVRQIINDAGAVGIDVHVIASREVPKESPGATETAEGG